MLKLSKDDLYEIEKILDIYAGTVNDAIRHHCLASIQYEAMMKGQKEDPLQQAIEQLIATATHLKAIRDELKRYRVQE